jgi:hypothetical protein
MARQQEVVIEAVLKTMREAGLCFLPERAQAASTTVIAATAPSDEKQSHEG